MSRFSLKSNHKPVKAYYECLDKFAMLGVKHETAVRSAFEGFCSLCRCSLNPNSHMTRPVSLGMLSQPHDEN